jgi:arylsulfatase
MERSIPFLIQLDESLDVGSDTLTGVNDSDYKPPFAFTGKIGKVTLSLDQPKLTPEDIKRLQEAQKVANAARE